MPAPLFCLAFQVDRGINSGNLRAVLFVVTAKENRALAHVRITSSGEAQGVDLQPPSVIIYTHYLTPLAQKIIAQIACAKQ